MMIDHVAAAMVEMSSGMATPSYSFRGIQIAHGIMAIIAMAKVNMPSLRFLGLRSRVTD